MTTAASRDRDITSMENEQPNDSQDVLVFMQMVLLAQQSEMKTHKGHKTEEDYLCTECQLIYNNVF